MRVSYQHANIENGNESTLLRFTTDAGTRACVLIDAGDGVDIDSLLGEDEYLNAILLTHAHIDHYRSLAKNTTHSAPIYTSPATATALEQALPEARKDNDLGNVDTALEAIEPITEWTSILNAVEVRPVPAGHTPGGAGFLVRFRDENGSGQFFDDEHHILATGDFTVRPCAGFAGLPTNYPFEIDAVLMNVSTTDTPSESYDKSIRTVLQRAYAGSRVVVAAGSLTGVHYATLLGTATEALDRQVPITAVGQTAKLYDALEMNVPGIEVRDVFDSVTDVLEHGGVTISGPSTPTKGSSERLFRAIKDDPDAVFVQLSADHDTVSNGQCTTHTYDCSNHPDIDTIDEVVRRLAPKEVVLKHATGQTLNRLQRRYDRCFTWGTNDSQIHCLYDEGEWQSPSWITERAAKQIRKNQWEAVQERSVPSGDEIPSLGSGTVTLESEGIDIDALEDVFSRNPPTLSSPSSSPQRTESNVAEPNGERSDRRSAEHPKRPSHPTCDGEFSRSFQEEVRERLTEIEGKLDRPERTVLARVLDGGEGTQFLQLLEEVDIDPGSVVEIDIRTQD